MSEARDFLVDLWRDLAGLPPVEPPRPMPSLDELRETEWNAEFERLMRNRLVMGAFRYCRLSEDRGYDNVRSAIARLTRYLEDGNGEHLVDAANLCLKEFTVEAHPAWHFGAQDDGEHTPMRDKP